MEFNLYAAWIGFVLGAVSGAAMGLFFHDERFMGGYGSWQRRMARLGHISFFGIGLLNIAFAATAYVLGIESGLRLPSILLLVAAVGMPLVCYLSVVWKPSRHLFFIPVASLTIATAAFLWRILP